MLFKKKMQQSCFRKENGAVSIINGLHQTPIVPRRTASDNWTATSIFSIEIDRKDYINIIEKDLRLN